MSKTARKEKQILGTAENKIVYVHMYSCENSFSHTRDFSDPHMYDK